MKKGEITAFLSLIFVLLVSFILAMTESASIQTAKNGKRLDVDRAVFSFFGEYQKELLEEYEVFSVEGTYETGHFAETLLLDRMAYYGSMGIRQEITEIQLLTDRGGAAFREQVLEYMEQRTGIAIARDLTGLAETWEEREMQGEDMSRQLDQILPENREILPEESNGIIQARESGILSLVLPRAFPLSGKTIRREEQVSIRSRQTGRGSFPVRSGQGKVEERLLFGSYIADKLGCAVEQKSENRNLDYELEYLLYGKESDKKNLEEVVNRLLFFRFAMNYMYLLTDAQKQGEVQTMSAAISLVVLQPELEELIRQILLILWAFGESVMDLRSLLSGKRSAVVKNAENWQLPLGGLFRLGTAEDTQEGMDAADGLTYSQYLQILLLLKKDSELTMRTLDRVEQNLIYEKGLSFFRADACVTKIKLWNTADIWNGTTYSFPAYYGYS
ncbi:MAG: hypothetical protein HFH24_11540 [Ruminococcus sp.]|nr:hypothetical protein [Ruminococcus sp.]